MTINITHEYNTGVYRVGLGAEMNMMNKANMRQSGFLPRMSLEEFSLAKGLMCHPAHILCVYMRNDWLGQSDSILPRQQLVKRTKERMRAPTPLFKPQLVIIIANDMPLA